MKKDKPYPLKRYMYEGYKIERRVSTIIRSSNEQQHLKFIKLYYDASIDAWTIKANCDILVG